MKKQLKKSTLIILALLVTTALSATVFAAGRWVQAWQDDTLKIKFNGVVQTFTDPDDGSKIVPLVYNGRTYLPVRAIATLAGLGVDYDEASNSVLLTSDGSTTGPKPVKDSNSYNGGTTTTQPTAAQPPSTVPVSNGTGTVSNAAGTLNDPVKFGQSFSWFDESKSTSFGFKSNVTMSVTNVKKLTDADIEAMGFKPSTDPSIDHVLVTVNLKGRNVTPTTLSDNYIYYSLTKPYVWGSKTPSGDSVIGGTDFGFEGSIGKNLDDRYPYTANKIDAGSSAALLDYSGNIILPILKGETNYLVMQRANHDLDYDSQFIYFKLN